MGYEDFMDGLKSVGMPDVRFGVVSTAETDDERKQADRRFASPNQRNAFRTMTLTSFDDPLAEELLHYKKGVVLDLRKRKLIDQDILQNHPTVYLGSGIDIEYPLCLGARKIILVDPVFTDQNVREDVLKKIAQMTGEEPVSVSKNTFSFIFDFGNGREQATVMFEQEPYASREEVSRYKIPESVGMILSILTPSGLTRGHNLDARSVHDKLVTEGTILVYGEALDEATMVQERTAFVKKNIRKGLPHDDKTAQTFLQDEARWIFKKYGYESIPMSPFISKSRNEIGGVMTFLKKI